MKVKFFQILFILFLISSTIILSSCELGYKNDGKEVTWHSWNEGNGYNVRKINANPATFKSLEDKYGHDDKHAFFEGEIIPEADGSSFKSLGEWYASDKNHVYLSGEKIEKADPNSFKVHNDRLGEDKNDFYYYHTPLNVKDKSTFEIIKDKTGDDTHWGKDKYNAYFLINGAVIKNIDYHSFRPILGRGYSSSGRYAVDKNKVYFEGQVVLGADPITFKEVDYFIGQDKYRVYKEDSPTKVKDFSKLTKVGSYMYKDDKYVYDREFNILLNSDVSTFENIEQNWYRDKKSVWWYNKNLRGADPKTFKPVPVSSYRNNKKEYFSWGDYIFGKDKSYVFCKDSIIEGADPESFEKIDFPDGRSWTVFDRHRVYQGIDSPKLREYLKHCYPK